MGLEVSHLFFINDAIVFLLGFSRSNDSFKLVAYGICSHLRIKNKL